MPTTLALTPSPDTVLATIITPLIAIHMAVMTFYIKSLRQQHQSNFDDVTRRIERVAKNVESLSRRIADHERHFTAKEDWLRESMLARQNIEQLTRTIAHLDAVQSVTSHTNDTTANQEHHA